jgi:hypothetical protein
MREEGGVMIDKNNEPAFPGFPCDSFQDRGMTLRDYFAAKAMAAMLSIEDVHLNNTETEIATWAYQQADAMMEARKQKKDEVV